MTDQDAEAQAPETEVEEPEAEAAPVVAFEPAQGAQVRWSLAAVMAISFSLTFVLMSVAMLAGVLPPAIAALSMPIDLGVLLLIVPLTALVLAILAEAFRAAIGGVPSPRVRRTVTALSDWQPGRGEG